MTKKIVKHCLYGAPAGVALYVAFTLWASWLRGDGVYHFTSGHLIQVYGSEVNAVAATCLGAMALGMIWAAASLIYQETDWNLLRQTALHCVVCVLPSLLIAYGMHWMPRSIDGLGQYLTVFGAIYILNWIARYFGMRKRIQQMNEKLNGLEDR